MIKDYRLLLKNIEETFNVCEVFKFRETCSWVIVKDSITNFFVKENVNVSFPKKDLLSPYALYLFTLSILNYFKSCFNRKQRALFVGAGSGLFEYNGEILDSYFPYNDISGDDVIYFLSADYSKRLYGYRAFLKQNKVVIYSFVFSPIKLIISKFVILFNISKYQKRFDNIYKYLNERGVGFTKKHFLNAHAKFVSGYILYYLILRPLRINKIYVVSSYSNSDIIAVLRKRNIEVIEIQHGLIGELHNGYNYKVKDRLLPAPNKIYVYNNFWKNELIQAGFYTEEQIYVYGRLKYSLVERESKQITGKYIVFTGQNCYYNEIKDFFKSSDPILSEKNISLYYIPHPNETTKSIDDLIMFVRNYNSIQIISKKMFATEKYIIDSVAHISLFSSCHFDAVNFLGKTFIFDIIKDNPFNYYTERLPDSFKKINHISELLKVIE